MTMDKNVPHTSASTTELSYEDMSVGGTLPPEAQAERRAYLAEHMWVGCSLCNGGGLVNKMKPNTLPDTCPDCHGSGRRYLLRRRCFKCDGKGSYTFNLLHHVCSECSGQGYVMDDSPTALTEAIRAKGWHLNFETYVEEGDHAYIYPNDTSTDALGGVSGDEGLRWPEVAEVALYRACKAEEGE